MKCANNQRNASRIQTQSKCGERVCIARTNCKWNLKNPVNQLPPLFQGNVDLELII